MFVLFSQYALEDERIAPLHPGEEIFCKGKIGKVTTN